MHQYRGVAAKASVFGVVAATAASIGLFAPVALAAPIDISDASVFMFRDSRGINDTGQTPGQRFQYGANVLGGSIDTFLGATYPPTGFTDTPTACSPLAVNANYCSNSTGYNASRDDAPWTLTFTRAGEAPLTVTGPTLTGTTFQVPQPQNVTISGSGLAPTISWTLPAGYVPDGFRAQILDKSTIRANGVADVIHSAAVSETATSYTFPTILSSGQTLAPGGNYSINFQVIETRGDIAFTGSNAQILTRSNSWFSFTPLDSSAPPNVHLPEVGTDPVPGDGFGAPYQFSVTEVGPSSVTFIDPLVAVGYDYAIGAGNPNFASVVLPAIGDGQFEVQFEGAAGPESIVINAGDQFFFQAGGVTTFKVRGIESSAGLDPENVTAFVTGLTFIANGEFTGTMTPVTLMVPEPESYALMLVGLGLIGCVARRRKR